MKNRQRRSEASKAWYITIVTIIVVFGISLYLGGLALALILVAIVAVIFLLFLLSSRIAALKVKHKLHQKVIDHKILWGGIALVLDGEDIFEGEDKKPVPTPGPKGTLILKPDTLSWIPNNATVVKGYERTVWAKDKYIMTKISSLRDYTGVQVETWKLSDSLGDATFQIHSMTDDLTKFL